MFHEYKHPWTGPSVLAVACPNLSTSFTRISSPFCVFFAFLGVPLFPLPRQKRSHFLLGSTDSSQALRVALKRLAEAPGHGFDFEQQSRPKRKPCRFFGVSREVAVRIATYRGWSIWVWYVLRGSFCWVFLRTHKKKRNTCKLILFFWGGATVLTEA